jgi:hypothetical protein
VPYSAKCTREDVKQEPADELGGMEGKHLPLIRRAIVLPAETDGVSIGLDKSGVGDGDAVGVAAEISGDMLRIIERAFGIDYPANVSEEVEVLEKRDRVPKR